jgi:dTDP-4-amino-4,6-dideoxygalactose transaminase
MSHPTMPRWPEVDDDTTRAVRAALLTGRLAVSGAPSRWPARNVLAATAMAMAVGRRYATLTSSGSSAIVTALQAAGVGPGDVVLVPATTWVSCATAILRVGAVPAYFDGTAESPCVVGSTPVDDPRAVLGVHLYAQHFDVAALRRRFPDAVLIEDASHAQLAETADSRMIGTLGDISIMSLQATKILTSGEGGVVLTDDSELAARVESLVMDSRRRVTDASLDMPNELEPAMSLHGANHALSEMAAGMLLDQLERFPRQAQRRADGLAFLTDELAGSDFTVFADKGAARSGNFYGVALRVPDHVGGVPELVAAVRDRCGVVLDRVYPPLPEGPLYRPHTVKQYAGLEHRVGALDRAREWHTRHVVVPHHVLLADRDQLRELVDALTGRAGSGPVRRTRRPSVEVVVVTQGRRLEWLSAALTSVAAQRDLDADVSVSVWLDAGADMAQRAALEGLGGVRCTVISGDGALPDESWARIAALRQLAATRCAGDYLAFLDDDNLWEPDHLASLLAVARQGIPAVHTWRRLVDPAGRPTQVDAFPWSTPGQQAVDRLGVLSAHGVMSPDSGVVRDTVQFGDGSVGMVDMGEWLFDRRLLAVLRLDAPRTVDELNDRVGEDDVVLRQLVRLGVPTACTRRPTLRYRLGGMSNPESVRR